MFGGASSFLIAHWIVISNLSAAAIRALELGESRSRCKSRIQFAELLYIFLATSIVDRNAASDTASTRSRTR